MLRYWPHLEHLPGRVALSVTAICLKIWSEASLRSGTMKQCNAATGQHPTDWTFGRCRVIVGAPAGLPNVFEEGEHVTETYEWDADPEECEEEEHAWVDEGDAYNGKDDEWYGDFHKMMAIWMDNLDLWKTAEACATTEVDNASSDTKSAARSFMDTKKLVAHVKAARGLFPVVGVGAFDALQSTTPRASAATKAPTKGKKNFSVKISGSWEMQKQRLAHGPRAPVTTGQCLWCRQMGHFARLSTLRIT